MPYWKASGIKRRNFKTRDRVIYLFSNEIAFGE